MNYQKLLNHACHFLEDSGVPVTVFCRKVGCKPSTFYRWRRGETRISGRLAWRINEYLWQFGYEAFWK